MRLEQGVGRQLALTRKYHDLPLFWKILLPFTLLMLVLGLAGAFLVVRDLSSNARRSLDRNLFAHTVTARAAVLDAEFSLLEAVRFAANLQGLPESTARGDRPQTAELLSSVAAVKQRIDLLVVTDESGEGLVEITRRGDERQVDGGHPWAETPFVASVLDGGTDDLEDKTAGLIDARGERYVAMATPVRRGEAVVGAVLAGIRTEDLAGEVSGRASTAVALYDDDARIVGASPEFVDTDHPLPRDAEDGRTVSSADGRFSTLHAPLELRGREVGMIGVQVPTDEALGSVRGASIRLALLLSAAMAAVVGVGVFLSRSIVSRLRPLIETNRALGRGELSSRVALQGRDELGELAEGFNQMAEQLEASYKELEMRVAERTEETQRLYEELLEATRSRSELLAGITHDFRTPVFAILGHAKMMQDPDFQPDDPSWREAFGETIYESGDYLLQLVNDLLDHAEFELGQAEVEREPMDIGALLSHLEKTVVPLARASDLEAVVDVDDDLPIVEADEARLRQIVLNLVSNAIKYTPAGGRITVTAVPKGRRVQVAVADTGVGVPEDIGERIFEPFYRVEGTHPQKGQASSGLGLALTKRLVEAHGGRIWYERTSDGTTFLFTLPATRRRKSRKRLQTARAG